MASIELPPDDVLTMLNTQRQKEIGVIQNILGRLTNYYDSGPAVDPNNNADAEKSENSNLIRWKYVDPVTQICFESTRKIIVKKEILDQKEKLPIFEYKNQFLNAVVNNQVVVVVGETGSGKSTQMPQYLLEAGVVCRKIGITQPRRVAAISVAERVAEELGCPVGDLVGYSIRFEDMTSNDTILKYMTDGFLLTESLRDPIFSSYGCIILDEAHERTLHTDVLLGLLKTALRKRPELKLIITSATLDIRKFANYFDSPMVKIPGKMYPVTVQYLPLATPTNRGRKGRNASSLWARVNYPEIFIEGAVEKVLEIHRQEPTNKGDILLFMPGKEEVELACAKIVNQCATKDLIAVPIYAALPNYYQAEIFHPAPAGIRKIVVATNIAETSLTIDGILHVVDTGYFKENIYDRGIDTLKVSVISKAQAEQRKGRAGRTAPGRCYRMYSPYDYEAMASEPLPSIHRIDLTATSLQLKAMGIDDICGFGFMDPPRPERVRYSLYRLRDLGALSQNFQITPLGFKMAEFPLSPHLSKILLTASEMSCSEEVLTVVSMLSVNYVFIRPKSRQIEADEKKKTFEDSHGDHLTLLKVFIAWESSKDRQKWAAENYIHEKELLKADSIRGQLRYLMNTLNLPVVGLNGRDPSNILRAFSSGSPNNVAYRDNWSKDKNAYKTLVDKKTVFIHPSSTLSKSNPDLVIFQETSNTSRNFMRIVSICEKSWIEKLQNQKRF